MLKKGRGASRLGYKIGNFLFKQKWKKCTVRERKCKNTEYAYFTYPRMLSIRSCGMLQEKH